MLGPGTCGLAAFVYFLMLALAPLALAAFGVYIYLCAQLEVQELRPGGAGQKNGGRSPLLLVPRVPVEECDYPFFGRGKFAGMFVDLNPRVLAVFFIDEFFPFFRRGKDMYAAFAAILGVYPC